MSVNDPVADMLVRLKNASEVYLPYVEVTHSRLIEQILSVLKSENYIKDFERLGDGSKKKLRVHLLYRENRKRAITEVKRVSRLSRRVYCNRKNLPAVCGGFGVAVLSTSRGIMSSRQARASGLGGEVLFYIW
ncbi:MAG TPA: 30S ribosomal protein S8 [bacterium]|nr:30S ribosomal protein S8 [bacterium]HPP12297.1 30S ribosomal protein S8 [bacterium]